MKWLERASSLFLMGFSILIFFSSHRLGIGRPGDPGPGFMPFLASIVLFSVSLLIFIMGIKRSDEDQKEKSITHLKVLTKPICLLIILSGYAILLGMIGFITTSFLSMFAMFSLAGPKKWRLNLVISVIIAILGFIIFGKWLQVQLPIGILGI